ncbi:integration host factor subunit beta [Thalassobacter stenotrophicus]|uniref:HU family DNA-binding protein n=1 Tax=Thalassobacter TaxID=266808 RepID=UPI0009FC1570|nr:MULTISPECIES: HU family DNA-binding protein [Thalassobacter]UYP69689.1 integration host factor subunit beta [Thalassobacter stenotrophicus]
MKRSELVALLAEENHYLTNADAEKVVASVFDTISGHLELGGRIELRGFGVFSVRHRNEGQRRNPRTGENVWVAAKSVPFFTTGRDLHRRLNPDL